MSARNKLNPAQGKLFMSAREIQSEYAPNQPDRLYHGTDISVARATGVRLMHPDPRAGEQTARTSRTDQSPNYMRAGEPGVYSRPSHPLQGDYAHPETDDQVYQRKLGESQRRNSGQPSLQDRIKSQGVLNPIALGELRNAGGKKMIAGGHHRVAVMAHLSPDQLLPVVPVAHVVEAKTLGL
jgi:hypothetical protein